MTFQGLMRFSRRASWGRAAVIVWAFLLGFVGVRAVVQPDSHDCYKPFYEPAGRHWLSPVRVVDPIEGFGAECQSVPFGQVKIPNLYVKDANKSPGARPAGPRPPKTLPAAVIAQQPYCRVRGVHARRTFRKSSFRLWSGARW